MSLGEVEDLLYQRSGLLGVSGISDDMRDLLASDSTDAADAIDLFCYRVTRELGSLAGALGGLDALVFTGGIGEHAPGIRANICDGGGWLGVEIDLDANIAGESRLDAPTSGVEVYVIHTDEELMIAQHTERVVSSMTLASAGNTEVASP